MKKIDIIILHYGDINVTKKCIESIEKYAKTYSTLIVVNNDPQITIEKVLKASPKRVFLNSGDNVGFARGVNNGIAYALKKKADYVVLLNNDTTVENDFIAPLYKVLESDQKIGIAGSVIKFLLNGKMRYDHGGTINKYTGSTHHNNRMAISSDETIDVDFISGCCMMIRKEVFEKVGIFNPAYFMYYEDVDFCIKARRKDYTIAVVTKSLINHALSKTIGKNSSSLIFQLTKSRLFFSKTHTEFPLRFLSLMVQSLKFMIKDPKKTGSIFRALQGK
jgi:GT2 family glycosyltransferase